MSLFKSSYLKKSAVAILCLAALSGCSKTDNNTANQEMPPMPVSVYTAISKDVPIAMEYPAQIKSIKQVQVTARVSGTLEDILYTEGSFVEKGTLLYKIDPTRYKATYDIAVANLSTAEATFKAAKREYDRASKLIKTNAVSQKDYDTALSAYESAQAGMKSAQASVTSAKVDLDYTNIDATISGVTSLNSVDIGSYVGTTAENSVLTTITQLDPVYVEFSIPDKEFLKRADDFKNTNSSKISTTITTPDGKLYEYNGTLDFLDSTIDASTATVKARATFENPDNKLLPGLFVRISINGLEESDTFTLPQAALMQDGLGSYVYKVGENGTVQKQSVNVGSSTRDGFSIITSGLKGNEKIIIDSLTKVRPGSKVAPTEAKEI